MVNKFPAPPICLTLRKNNSAVFITISRTPCVWDKDRTCSIKRPDYLEGYTLFAFDLSTDQCSGQHHYSLMRSGTLRLECKFAEALQQGIHIVCLAEYENLLEIDANRTIAFDYTV